MSVRSDVSPSTLPVELDPDGVFVEYLDGRRAFYHGVPAPTTGPVRCRPETYVQVLVTDPDGTAGVMIYVNDRKTHDDVLEASGVGRIVLDQGEEAELVPGVVARVDGYVVVIDADPHVVDGRVFVFEEDDRGEESHEIVAEGEDDREDETGR